MSDFTYYVLAMIFNYWPKLLVVIIVVGLFL